MQKAVKFLINQRNKKLWLVAIACGALFGFFYQTMALNNAKDKFKEFHEKIYITKKITILPLDIPMKDTYLLKLKGGLKEHNQPEKAFINGHLLKKYRSKRKRLRGTKYRLIPSDLVHKEKNELKLICPHSNPFRLHIIYRNYRKASRNRLIFLLFDSSRCLSKISEVPMVATKMLFGILFLCGFWIVTSAAWIKILYLPEKRIYLYGLISFIPSLLIFLIVYLASIFSPYHIAFSMGYFWVFVITLVCMSNICLISRGIWLGYKSSRHLFKVPSLQQYLKLNRVFKPIILNQNIIKSIEWVKSRELSDKLILSFMALLVMCALLLCLGLEPIAEQLANIAYFALVIAVVRFLKENSD